jgi:hypothetical protein
VAQHDYIISNQSGAAFRGDLNNGLAAIVSQNSGATQPSTTYAYQWWADTTTGLLKIRNAANSAWITVGTLADANLGLLSLAGGTLTGAVLADDAGTAALPAIAFDGDTNTGIFRKGADQLGLSTGGTERGFIDSNGVTIQAQGDLRLADSDSSNWVALHAPTTVASNITLTVPSTVGTADEALVTDGTGALSFASRSRLVRATAVATTSGTSIDFTSIPSWVRRITVLFTSVSTSGTSPVQIQIGDSGGVETTGYTGTHVSITAANIVNIQSYTNGAALIGVLATSVRSGSMVITNIDGNQWQFSSIHTNEDSGFLGFLGSIKTLSATLDRVRLTTVNGTDTFDAGLANIIYEG